jgi:hypothetical protein
MVLIPLQYRFSILLNAFIVTLRLVFTYNCCFNAFSLNVTKLFILSVILNRVKHYIHFGHCFQNISFENRFNYGIFIRCKLKPNNQCRPGTLRAPNAFL